MLKIENVTKYYDKFKAVDNLSFEVKGGDIFGLLGVNGAGKTTTFRMIMGLLEPNSGIITFNDQKIDYDTSEKIGFLTEERSLLTKLTVLEQAVYYGVLKGMEESVIEEKLDYWLKRFGIADYKTRKIKELSKGNQQKIQFIISFLHEPKLLILDEPFSGLDPLNVELFEGAIKELSEKGVAIIFSSHRMEHVEKFCEKILILLRGKSVLAGNLNDIKRDYRKKNIIIKGDVDKKTLEKIKGVVNVLETKEHIEVKIEDQKYVEDVFQEIAKSKNITQFSVEEPSLNEIFVSKVGESYE